MSKPLILELKEKIDKFSNLITAQPNSDYEITKSGDTQIKINLTSSDIIGNKFTFESGKIIIGKGISKVLVASKLNLDLTKIENTFLYIKKNGSTIVDRASNYGQYVSVAIPMILDDVQEGDYFEIYTLPGTSGTVRNQTSLTVIGID